MLEYDAAAVQAEARELIALLPRMPLDQCTEQKLQLLGAIDQYSASHNARATTIMHKLPVSMVISAIEDAKQGRAVDGQLVVTALEMLTRQMSIANIQHVMESIDARIAEIKAG